MKPLLPLTVLVMAATALTSCGQAESKLSGITKLIRPGDDKKTVADAPPAKPQDPMARPVQVAWTSARAKKCGFYFHPQKLKASLIAYETAQGAAPEYLDQVQKAYDLTSTKVSANLQDVSLGEYCDERKVEEIRKDLNRHLAGDFTPRVRKQEKIKKKKSRRFFALGGDNDIGPLDRNEIFYPGKYGKKK